MFVFLSDEDYLTTLFFICQQEIVSFFFYFFFSLECPFFGEYRLYNCYSWSKLWELCNIFISCRVLYIRLNTILKIRYLYLYKYLILLLSICYFICNNLSHFIFFTPNGKGKFSIEIVLRQFEKVLIYRSILLP